MLLNIETSEQVKRKLNKIKKVSSNPIEDKINANENLYLEYKDSFQLITTKEDLAAYIEESNKIDYIAIDTETEGLNPILDKIAGLCIYTEGQKAAYVPINHIDFITHERLGNQLTEKEVKECLEKLTAKVLMFNAVFDCRVLYNQVGIDIPCYWDCMIAHKCLDENSKRNGLKPLYQRYINPNDKLVGFVDVFGSNKITLFPPKHAYIYAAKDAMMTYELFKFQEYHLKKMPEVYNLFMNIEMPVVHVVRKMEDYGLALNIENTTRLAEKYRQQKEASLKESKAIIKKWSSFIDDYNAYALATGKKVLDKDINLQSAQQMAILLYDVLKIKQPIKKGKQVRTTDKDTVRDFAAKGNCGLADKEDFALFADAYLAIKRADKLLGTYLEKMPTVAIDNRVHCRFNQYGAATGRFSSNDPNLQNIPNGECRTMFCAGTDYNEVEYPFVFDRTMEVEVNGKFKFVETLKAGDELQTDEGPYEIKNVTIDGDTVIVK